MTITMTKPEKYFLAGYMLFELWLLPWLLQLLVGALPLEWTSGAVNFLFFLINFLAVVTISGRFLTQNLTAAIKAPETLIHSWFVWFAVYWASTILVSNLIALVSKDFANVNDAAISVITETSPTLMVIGTVFLVPLVEECLYRGLLFGALRSRSRIAAYAVSTLLFSLIHVTGYIGTYPLPLLALCLLQYIPAGLCLARSYEASDNIFTPILIHTTVNAIGMIAMR